MRLPLLFTAGLAVVALLIGVRGANTSPPALQLQVHVPPTPVVVDGASEIVYELSFTNPSSEFMRLISLDVLDARSGSPLSSFGADALRRRIALPDSTLKTEPRVVPPRSSGVVYIEFSEARGAAPTSLRHRVRLMRLVSANDVDETIEGDEVEIRRDAPVVLGAPLRGGPWAAIYNAAWERGHRRVFYAVDGKPRIPGRFAIDWIKLDEEGHTARADPDLVANAVGYGDDVLAVVDATVAATRDDVDEVSRVSARRKHAVEDASGNYIALEAGTSRFVVYEHLKPGSVRVKRGHRVRKGQVIAALGFTGDSTGPHLHLHVADAASPLGGEGLPFVLDRFSLRGVYTDIADLGKQPWAAAPGPAARRLERPMSGAVIDFGGR